MTTLGKVLCVSAISLVFLGAGAEIEAKKTSVTVVEQGRFQKITDTTALDSKTGLTCDTAPIHPKDYPGITLDTGRPSCSDLPKQ